MMCFGYASKELLVILVGPQGRRNCIAQLSSAAAAVGGEARANSACGVRA